jgi:hypothetical protein
VNNLAGLALNTKKKSLYFGRRFPSAIWPSLVINQQITLNYGQLVALFDSVLLLRVYHYH